MYIGLYRKLRLHYRKYWSPITSKLHRQIDVYFVFANQNRDTSYKYFQRYFWRLEAPYYSAVSGPLRHWNHGFEYCSDLDYVPLLALFWGSDGLDHRQRSSMRLMDS
jgi:hypothetical protein